MTLKSTAGAALLVAMATQLQAGSIDRSRLPLDLLFESGNVLQFSANKPMFDISSGPLGGTGSVFESYLTTGMAFRTELTDDLAFALFFNRPYGANGFYQNGTYAGYRIDWASEELAAVLVYDVTDNLSAYGGVRAVRSEVNLTLPAVLLAPASINYALNSGGDTGLGYLLGVSYSIPERGARVSLTYQSAVSHSFDSTEEFTFLGTTFGRTEVELPQSLRFDGEIALSSNTLLLGSATWSDYSNFDVAAPGFATLVVPGASVIDYQEDSITASIGLGHSLNDDWSIFGIVDSTFADSEPTALRPFDGNRSLTLGAIFARGQFRLTGGARYTSFNDATVLGADFSGDYAITPFLTIDHFF